MFPVSVTREQGFLKVMKDCLWWEHVLEKQQYSYILQSSRVNSIMCIITYEKVVLVEMSRNSFWLELEAYSLRIATQTPNQIC